MNDGITDRQQAFVEAYVKCRNATEAAIAAGYSPDSARYQGSKLRADPRVKAKIDEMLANVAFLAEVEIVDVVKGLKSIAEDDDAPTSPRVSAWGKIAQILTDREQKAKKEQHGVAVFNFPTLPRPSEQHKWNKLRALGVDVDTILSSGVLLPDDDAGR